MKEILITSSVLIGLILLLRWLLRGKVRHKLLYAAWLLVALRLLVPIQFGQWSFSLNTLTQTVTEQSETLQQAEQILQTPVTGPSKEVLLQQLMQEYRQQGLDPEAPEIQIQLEEQVQKTAPTLSQILKTVWFAGIGVMALWFLLANLSFHRKARAGAVPLETDAPVSVRVSSGVPTPCLVGLFRPVIYVTPGCTEDPRMLRHVLTHETAHLRQGDPIWSLVRCLCLCVYWFHPLVWVAAAQSKRDCELSCDESALRRLGDEERTAYGKTLLSMVRSASPTVLLNTATSMSESKKQLKERMCFIVKKPRNLLIAAIAMTLVIALAAGCAFTGGKTPEETPPSTEPTPTQPVTDPPSKHDDLLPVPSVPEELVPTLVREDIYMTKEIIITPENLGIWKCPVGLKHALHIPQLSLDTPGAMAFNRILWEKYSPPLWILRNGVEGSSIFLCEFQWTVTDGIIGIIVYEGNGAQMSGFHSIAKGYYFDVNADRELTMEEYMKAMGTNEAVVLSKVKATDAYQQTNQAAKELTACLVSGEHVLGILKDDTTLKGWLAVETAPIGVEIDPGPVQFPGETDLFETVFQKDTPREELVGTWLAHVAINENDRFSYTLTLREDGTAEYRWGYYGSDLLERLEGTWGPASGEDQYALNLTLTGGVRFEDNPAYDLTATQRLRCSEDGTSLQAQWCGGTQLFHFYSNYDLILYRYDVDSIYYDIPIQYMPGAQTVEE